MKSLFESLLETDELDVLLKLRGQIENLDAEEEQRAVAVLESWSDQQAVSNLLFCPGLIPTSDRERFVLRGLADLKNPYFVLATVVGVASLAEGKISRDARVEIKCRLIGFCREYADLVGQRASVSLRAFLEKADLPELQSLLNVRNEVIRENIIGGIVQVWGGLAPEKMSEEFKAAGLSWFQRRRVLKSVREFAQKRSGLVGVFKTTPLLSYIPNLKEVRS